MVPSHQRFCFFSLFFSSVSWWVICDFQISSWERERERDVDPPSTGEIDIGTMMLQRAASNAYSWWWASHIRTKQSKWLEQNLQGMNQPVWYNVIHSFALPMMFVDPGEITVSETGSDVHKLESPVQVFNLYWSTVLSWSIYLSIKTMGASIWFHHVCEKAWRNSVL